MVSINFFRSTQRFILNRVSYGLRERYEHLKKHGNMLGDIKRIIDPESLRPLLIDLFTNDADQCWRTNCYEILIVKIPSLKSFFKTYSWWTHGCGDTLQYLIHHFRPLSQEQGEAGYDRRRQLCEFCLYRREETSTCKKMQGWNMDLEELWVMLRLQA